MTTETTRRAGLIGAVFILATAAWAIILILGLLTVALARFIW